MSLRNEIEAQIAAKRREYAECQAKIKIIERKISRLKKVKSVLSDRKSDFKVVRTQTSKIFERDYNWRGAGYDRFTDIGKDLDDRNQNYRNVILDNALDSLNDEITRLENAVNREYGILGGIKSLINSLSNEIENLFN